MQFTETNQSGKIDGNGIFKQVYTDVYQNFHQHFSKLTDHSVEPLSKSEISLSELN